MNERNASDRELEEVVRATFAGRAERVTGGPGWHGPGNATHQSPADRHRRVRWIAPLAAAAVVAAIAGGLLAVRGSGDDHPAASRPPTTSPDAPPVPTGMKPVSALGIEIFVPADLPTNNVCGGFIRPLPLPMPICPYVPGTVVQIMTATDRGATRCVATVRLEAEDGCVVASPGVTRSTSSGTRQATELRAIWPAHDVQIVVSRTFDPSRALQIIRSVHAVPVDRNGCAARNDELFAGLPRNIPDPSSVQIAGTLLPTSGIDGMSVCWYVGNRLVASALLDADKAATMARVVNGLPPKWPAPTPQPSLPTCQRLGAADGVVLIAHTEQRGDVEAIAQLAACNGQRTASNGIRAGLIGPEVAKTLAELTDIPFSDGYRSPSR